jgi:hypothetical protein
MGASSPVQDFQASSTRARIPGIFNLAAMDINIVDTKMRRDLNKISHDIRTMGSKQRAQAGGTGLAVGSKSFLMVMSDTTSQFERMADDVRTDAELSRQRIWYSAQLQAQQLENSARLSDIRGSQARASQQQNAIKSVFGGLSRLGG